MNLSVVVDWKFAVAIGTTIVGIIGIKKMDSTTVERVYVHTINALKEYSIALKGSC